MKQRTTIMVQGLILNSNVIIGTAGHVDHGKSSLVHALTGTDPDRLKEEKLREMTTDLGFAFLKLTNNTLIPIIDVPGHEKFVKTMVAGAIGIDIVLFVIAADEGIALQTREHLDIVKLLRIPHGIIVLTKIDLVKDDWLSLVEDDVRKLIDHVFLHNASIIKVSSKTGQGIDELKQAIEQLVHTIKPHDAHGAFRLHIDRAFIIQGFGTVVTGTTVSGSISMNDEVEILPQKKLLRVRGIRVCEQEIKKAFAGQRTAVNLVGIEKNEIQRGDVLCEKNIFTPTMRIDAYLELAENCKTFEHNTRVFFHHGTAELSSQILLLQEPVLAGGTGGYVHCKLDKPIIAEYGDRFIIRSISPSLTLGGGCILNPHPGKNKKKKSKEYIEELTFLLHASLEERLLHNIKKNSSNPQSLSYYISYFQQPKNELKLIFDNLIQKQEIFACGEGETVRYIDHFTYLAFKKIIIDALNTFFKKNPYLSGIHSSKLKNLLPSDVHIDIFQSILEDLKKNGKISINQGNISLSGYIAQLTEDQQRIRTAIEEHLLQCRFLPPSQTIIFERISTKTPDMQAMWHMLIDEKKIIKIDEQTYFHTNILQEAQKALADYLSHHPDITAATYRDILKTNRKIAVSLLEYFDTIHLTRRQGDVHIRV